MKSYKVKFLMIRDLPHLACASVVLSLCNKDRGGGGGLINKQFNYWHVTVIQWQGVSTNYLQLFALFSFAGGGGGGEELPRSSHMAWGPSRSSLSARRPFQSPLLARRPCRRRPRSSLLAPVLLGPPWLPAKQPAPPWPPDWLDPPWSVPPAPPQPPWLPFPRGLAPPSLPLLRPAVPLVGGSGTSGSRSFKGGGGGVVSGVQARCPPSLCQRAPSPFLLESLHSTHLCIHSSLHSTHLYTYSSLHSTHLCTHSSLSAVPNVWTIYAPQPRPSACRDYLYPHSHVHVCMFTVFPVVPITFGFVHSGHQHYVVVWGVPCWLLFCFCLLAFLFLN